MNRIPKRSYTEQYRQEAVRLAGEVGPAEAARWLEMPVKTLNNWVRWSHRGKRFAGENKRVPVTELEAENQRLRAENVRLKMEREILKNLSRGGPLLEAEKLWRIRYS
jgi:transposase